MALLFISTLVLAHDRGKHPRCEAARQRGDPQVEISPFCYDRSILKEKEEKKVKSMLLLEQTFFIDPTRSYQVKDNHKEKCSKLRKNSQVNVNFFNAAALARKEGKSHNPTTCRRESSTAKYSTSYERDTSHT
jgi:hypothetical protein